jgi:hypothetical protein
MQKYKSSTKQTNLLNERTNKISHVNIVMFVKLHIPLLSLFYIFEFTNFWHYHYINNIKDATTLLKNLYYYANFNKKNKYKYLITN